MCYKDTHPLVLGDAVTVGHGAILHGCTIESRVLIGMGAILLNGAKIGEGSIVAAGTLVPEGTVVPPGSLFMGHPGKFRRALTPEDQASIEGYAARYVEYSEGYKVGQASSLSLFCSLLLQKATGWKPVLLTTEASAQRREK